MASRQCQFCGAAVTVSDPIPRDSSCESCQRDYRCCKQCRHYDTSRNNSCRETEAEPVADKERRNFCEFFDGNPAPFAGGPGAPATRTRADEARARLDALFKKKPDAS